MMKINVLDAKQKNGSCQKFHFIISPSQLDISDDNIKIIGDIVVDGNLVYTGRLFQVDGSIVAQVIRICDRCLTEFKTRLNIDFSEKYLNVDEENEDVLDEKSEDVLEFTGDNIDVSGLVRDNIMLFHFTKALCKTDCRGLCLKCGTNLNKHDCDCDRHIIDPRLAALENLLKNKNV